MKVLNSNGGELQPAVCTAKKSEMVFLFDNGHASSTPGKRSPKFKDGTQFFEWEFNRDIVKRVTKQLDKLGIKYHILVPEDNVDIPLTERANRANKYCRLYGADKCIFISCHANAAGSGSQWMNAQGWEIYTTKGQNASDKIATIFYEEAENIWKNRLGRKMRQDKSDGDPDKENNYTVIYKTQCRSVLLEQGFYDNEEECKFLLSEEGRNVCAEIIVNAIKRIVKCE